MVARADMGDVDNFEWDNNKAAGNYTKHGVSFKAAMNVFRDPFCYWRNR
jgi:uncharacterized DUF497 family protein